MPGPELEPLPEMPPEEVARLREEYKQHTPGEEGDRVCGCGRPKPCDRRHEIHVQLVASGNAPEA